MVIELTPGAGLMSATRFVPASESSLSNNSMPPPAGSLREKTTELAPSGYSVRTLDDIDFRLKAGLVGLVGEARITRAGLTLIKSTVEGILGPLKRGAVIDDFSVSIPVLDVLAVPESARTAADNNLVTTARANRSVDMVVSVTYGPAVHRLRVVLKPKF